ncbi:hypothetical protein [Gordonia terrae]
MRLTRDRAQRTEIGMQNFRLDHGVATGALGTRIGAVLGTYG